MLSGEGNKNGEKTIGLISKKATLHVQHTFFVHFFAVVLHEYNVKLSETSWLRFMEEMSYVFLFIFFSLPLIFTLVTARISLPPPLQHFHVVLAKKSVSFLFYLSLSCLSLFFSLSFADFLFLSVSLFLCVPNLWT